MLRILLPTIDYPPARGGVARYISAIVKTYPDQVTLLPLKKWQWRKLGNLVMTLAWQGRGYDALWVHQVLPVGTAAMIVKKFSKKPYVVFLHGLDFDLARRNAWKRWILRGVLRQAQRIVTNSEALAAEVRDFVQLEQPPLVIYPTLADELVAAAGVTQGANQKVNLRKLGELALGVARSATPLFIKRSRTSPDTLRLLTVARLVDRKGHLRVLEALKLIPDASYHIVGDGPMRAALEAKIAELGLEDRVRLTTTASDDQLPNIYRDADVFVMPTRKTELDREGFGIVYLEAQLFGLPVIASRQPGVDEAVRDGEGGLLIGASDRELVAAIERLKDSTTRSKFGSRGRTWVLQNFTREEQMYKLRELL